MQGAMVALVMWMVGVPQVVDRVMVLLVMPPAGECVAGDGRLRGWWCRWRGCCMWCNGPRGRRWRRQ